MNIFESIILDIVLILFPVLCYIIYMFFAKTLEKERNKLILDVALFSSIYLLFKYGVNSYNSIPLILFDIPLIIAYIKNRRITAIIITILLIMYYKITFSANIYIIIISYVIYFILYFIKSKRLLFVNFSLLIKSIIFYSMYINIHNMYDVIIIIFVFYIITKCIIDIFNNTESVVSLYNSLEKFERDKQSKESLFKITHEIKNPIAVVKGYLDMYDTNNIEHSTKYIPIIKEEINRVLMLLEDFLCITKIKIEKEEIDVSLLIEDIKNCFELILKGRNIKFECKSINEIYINADYNRLKQVLVNLIKNSMESIKDEGVIKLSVSKNKNKIYIKIEDNGVGMNQEEIKKIKQAFFTTKKSGTGLGIYLSNEIIEAHNGILKYSSNKNKGTTATIIIPIQ